MTIPSPEETPTLMAQAAWELEQMPMPAALAQNEVWAFEQLHRAIWRHASYDHDCQTTVCLALFLWNSAEMTALLADAYERGKQDAKAALDRTDGYCTCPVKISAHRHLGPGS